jgi:hypothetical protein
MAMKSRTSGMGPPSPGKAANGKEPTIQAVKLVNRPANEALDRGAHVTAAPPDDARPAPPKICRTGHLVFVAAGQMAAVKLSIARYCRR